jgi:hypothetical protein
MPVAGSLVREGFDLDEVLEVLPTIDGVELLDLIHSFEQRSGTESTEVSYGGTDPKLPPVLPLSQHFLTTDRKVPLLGCECGEWGCWRCLRQSCQSRCR